MASSKSDTAKASDEDWEHRRWNPRTKLLFMMLLTLATHVPRRTDSPVDSAEIDEEIPWQV